MSNLKKWLVPLVILIASGTAFYLIKENPPQSRRGGPPNGPKMTVEIQKLSPQRFTVMIDSYGTVQPKTQSALVAQVSGQIEFVSPKFKNGGVFKKDDVLIKLDQRDYQANVKLAEADLLTAQQKLLEEQANAKQAQIDWQRLGDGKPANDLVLRKPQLAAAQARLLSAEAGLTRAELAIERTEIKAPYDGIVLSQLVDFGQVLGNNHKVADIYSTGSVEIRLPINNSDIDLVNFPETIKNYATDNNKINVQFTSSLTKNQGWTGNITRTEGAIDTKSQQLHLVGQIDQPYDLSVHPGTPIKIGQYVSASIVGKTVTNAIVINNSAIYQGTYVYVVEDGLLKRRDIQIRWQNKQQALIESGLSAHEALVITPLGQVSSGTPVIVAGADSKNRGANNQLTDREQRMRKMAEKMGITIEELKARRQENGPRAGRLNNSNTQKQRLERSKQQAEKDTNGND